MEKKGRRLIWCGVHYQNLSTSLPHGTAQVPVFPCRLGSVTIGGISVPRFYKIMLFECLLMPPVVTGLLRYAPCPYRCGGERGHIVTRPVPAPLHYCWLGGSSTFSLKIKSTKRRRLITYFLVASSTSEQSPHFYVPKHQNRCFTF